MAKRKAQHWHRVDGGKKASRKDLIRHLGQLEGIVQGQAARLGVYELEKPADVEEWVGAVAEEQESDEQGESSEPVS